MTGPNPSGPNPTSPILTDPSIRPLWDFSPESFRLGTLRLGDFIWVRHDARRHDDDWEDLTWSRVRFRGPSYTYPSRLGMDLRIGSHSCCHADLIRLDTPQGIPGRGLGRILGLDLTLADDELPMWGPAEWELAEAAWRAFQEGPYDIRRDWERHKAAEARLREMGDQGDQAPRLRGYFRPAEDGSLLWWFDEDDRAGAVLPEAEWGLFGRDWGPTERPPYGLGVVPENYQS
jgi:hypothetical protein